MILMVIINFPVPAISSDEGQAEHGIESRGPRPHGQEYQVRLYRTRKERREVGLQRPITPWLRFSGLAELEVIKEEFGYRDDIEATTASEQNVNLQLGLEATPLQWLQGELLIEYDSAPDDLFLEELTITAERDSLEIIAGKQYLPFGKYFSNFVSPPIVEIGETQETAITVSYEYDDRFKFQASVYEGVALRIDSDEKIDWAFAFDAVLHERVGAGMSYLTDLGDAGGRLLEDENNRFARKVPGISGYLVWVGDRFDTTFEVAAAERSFAEFEAEQDQPLAWNLELALNVSTKFDVAFRVEGSRELTGFPETQYGVAVNLSLHPRATLTFEALRGKFTNDLATDDDDNPFKSVTTVGAQLSFAF